MAYSKEWLSYEDQLLRLIDRGMHVSDRAKALEFLQRIGYYRLSGYWYPFRERSGEFCRLTDNCEKPKNPKTETIALDEFKPGTNYGSVIDLYVFDKKLRHLTMDALERIEIALRVDVSHTLGKIDKFAYAKAECLHDTFTSTYDQSRGTTGHHAWMAKHGQLIARSKEEFVRHNRERYGLPLAIWVACEVWDFGTMSTLFNGMKESDQDGISAKYGVKNGRVFASWLRSLNYLRNVCAHHSRLWNRNIVDQPKLPPAADVAWVAAFEGNGEAERHSRARCFLLLHITRHILSVVNPRSTWGERMKAHLLAFPDLSAIGVDATAMGTYNGWEAQW